MTTLSSTKTYQLWGIINGKPISIALMGNSNPTDISFTVADSKGLSELAVTIEPAGGSVAPTSPIVASGTVSA
jgi:anti-sigma-K factor RskA